MATIALQLVGSALGTSLGGGLGGALGSALGGMLGASIDRAWLGSRKPIPGPRLGASNGITASEGVGIARVYGRVRLGGQVIWATEFEEEQHIERSGRSGGKSIGGGGGTRKLTYVYYANVAIGLCEGPLSLLRRVWADGKELDLATLNLRFYRGDRLQAPDPLIVAKQGSADIPAFRGLAYVVLERFALANYGNRLPQFAFEVVRASPGLPEQIRAVNLIPGATEFGYAQAELREDLGYGSSRAINRTQWTHQTDWDASLSELQALAPKLERATLVCAWFGDDLRVGRCTLRPKVEKTAKATLGGQWSAAGLDRAAAAAVSTTEGRPSFGGSPSDASVIGALRDLKARGLKVALHPFILMDIPAGNSLNDPRSGAAGQPAFPWRGRIICDPAPGRAGTPEGTAALEAQIRAFAGSARAAHFSFAGDSVLYSGPEEWSFRRLILHHAMLAKAAGGVDTFILSSELVGLTHCRGAGNAFPFVAVLVELARELRPILGPACTITYAADWTEYGARVREDGQDVRFPLDALWSEGEIGAIGIDFYPPLSDWRLRAAHLDAALASHGAEGAYLKARLNAGEGYDFYYASPAAREAQIRDPIQDGAYGKPWIFRFKDIKGFWSNRHHERLGGIEQSSPTRFVPQSKPIFLTEIGCPAVSCGANQPNVFPDRQSSENALPHFSSGARDDLVQRRAIEACLHCFDPGLPGFREEDNPVASGYAGRMIEASFIAPWAWDARPFPVFPRQRSLWADGNNWLRGHWLNGRLEGVPLRELLLMAAADFGVGLPQVADIAGFLDGYVIERPMSLRAALEPVVEAFSLLLAIKAGAVAVIAPPRSARRIDAEDLIPSREGNLIEVSRRQDSEMPSRFSLGFCDDEDGFRTRVVQAGQGGSGGRELALETALCLPMAQARRLAEQRLGVMSAGRENWSFRLPARYLDVEIGDRLDLPTPEGTKSLVVTRIVDGEYRTIEALNWRAAPPDYLPDIDALPGEPRAPALPGAAFARLVELPLARERGGLLSLALRADPWRGPYSLIETSLGKATPFARIAAPARIGRLVAAFPPGPLWRWDRAATLDITLMEGTLADASEAQTLAGGNALALFAPDGQIEIVLFSQAKLVGQARYRLRGLLRGLGGSEAAASRTLAAGALAIVLDAALVDLDIGPEALGQARSFALLPAGRALGDGTRTNLDARLSGVALRPLAPVHLRGRREAGGIRLRFTRRARIGGDNWEAFEEPLAEASEAYRLEILAGGHVKRRIELSLPEYLYPAALERADFGAACAVLSVRVAQVSAVMGPGAWLEGDVVIR